MAYYKVGRKSKSGKPRGFSLIESQSLDELKAHPKLLKKRIGKKNYVDWNDITKVKFM